MELVLCRGTSGAAARAIREVNLGQGRCLAPCGDVAGGSGRGGEERQSPAAPRVCGRAGRAGSPWLDRAPRTGAGPQSAPSSKPGRNEMAAPLPLGRARGPGARGAAPLPPNNPTLGISSLKLNWNNGGASAGLITARDGRWPPLCPGAFGGWEREEEAGGGGLQPHGDNTGGVSAAVSRPSHNPRLGRSWLHHLCIYFFPRLTGGGGCSRAAWGRPVLRAQTWYLQGGSVAGGQGGPGEARGGLDGPVEAPVGLLEADVVGQLIAVGVELADLALGLQWVPHGAVDAAGEKMMGMGEGPRGAGGSWGGAQPAGPPPPQNRALDGVCVSPSVSPVWGQGHRLGGGPSPTCHRCNSSCVSAPPRRWRVWRRRLRGHGGGVRESWGCVSPPPVPESDRRHSPSELGESSALMERSEAAGDGTERWGTPVGSGGAHQAVPSPCSSFWGGGLIPPPPQL